MRLIRLEGLYMEYIFSTYKVTKIYAGPKGIKIYNATSSDRLEVFEWVDLDFLLGEESKSNFNLIYPWAMFLQETQLV